MKDFELKDFLSKLDVHELFLLAYAVSTIYQEDRLRFDKILQQRLNLVNKNDLTLLKEKVSDWGNKFDSLKNISVEQYAFLIKQSIPISNKVEIDSRTKKQLEKFKDFLKYSRAVEDFLENIVQEVSYSYLTSELKVDLKEFLQRILNIDEIDSIDEFEHLNQETLLEAFISYVFKDISSDAIRSYDEILCLR